MVQTFFYETQLVESISLASDIQKKACKLVYLQLAGVLILAAITLLINGTVDGFSVLAGGMTYGLSTLIFAWLVFRCVKNAYQFLVALFIGEMLKLGLSALLFLMIMKLLPINLLAAVIGFIGAIVSFWIACLLFCTKEVIPSDAETHTKKG